MATSEMACQLVAPSAPDAERGTRVCTEANTVRPLREIGLGPQDRKPKPDRIEEFRGLTC